MSPELTCSADDLDIRWLQPQAPAQMAKLTVHHLENSRSQRILWLLEELGLEYEIERYARHPKTMRAGPELERVHPLGKSPLLSDGDRVVAESGAIVEYLLEHHSDGQLVPAKDSEQYHRYRFFMHYAEGSLMPPLLVKLVIGTLRSAPVPFFLKPLVKGIASKVDRAFTDPEIEKHLSYLEQELKERDWFAGPEISGADFLMSFPLEGAAARGGLGLEYPRLTRYLGRVHGREAYQRALKRGGPYRYA